MAELITDQARFDEVVDQIALADRYAIDTEFHRERTYFPQLALVQLAWHDTAGDKQLVLVDPLAVNIKSFAKVLDGPGLCVLHAGMQDLEILDLACGTAPSHMLDTQIAAGFLGIATGSLLSVLDRFMGVTIKKGDRLTDWLRRPLTDDQLTYAASDVDYLLELTDIICEQLDALQRRDWAFEESALALAKPRTRRPPEEAVQRIKEARSLKGNKLVIATALAEWRERRAASLDMPVRQVLPDIAVVAIAQQAPTAPEALRKIRGLDGRHLRNGADKDLLATVAEAKKREPVKSTTPRLPDLPKELRPVVTLVTAWISQIARDEQLDPALLATRSDIEGVLRGDTEGRLSHGWRADLAGGPIQALVNGQAAIAFDGGGRLVLERRSAQPFGSSAQAANSGE